jgi:hypothetical protein
LYSPHSHTSSCFGILVAEGDFPEQGSIAYRPPSISGKETDPDKVRHDLAAIAEMIAQASAARDRIPRRR